MKASSRSTAKSHTAGQNSETGTSRRNSRRKQNEASVREDQSILAAAEEVAKLGSWKWDLRTQKVTWSDEMFRLFGVEREGFDGDVNRIIAERIHPDDKAAVAESNRRVLEEANPVPLSYRIVLPNGMERTVWAQGQLVHDETGQAIALTGFIQDISERVRAEKKIIQLKRLYATLSQVNQMIVRVKDRDELFQTICDITVKFGEFSVAWIGLLDESSGDVPPLFASGIDVKNWPFPIVNIHSGPLSHGLVSRALHTSKVTISEDLQADQHVQSLHGPLHERGFHSSAVIPFRLRNKNIGTLTLISPEIGLFKEEEEVSLLDEMGLDISFALDNLENEHELSLADKILRESEARFSKIFHSSPTGINIFQLSDGRSIDVNDAFLEMIGYSREEVLSHTAAELNLFVDAQARNNWMKKLREGGSVQNQDAKIRRKTGETRDTLASLDLLDINGKQMIMVIATDITERKQIEEKLRESEERYRQLMELSPVGIAVHMGGRLVFANQAAARILGGNEPKDIIGRSVLEIIHPDSLARAGKRLERMLNGEQGLFPVEERYLKLDGSEVPVEVMSAPLTYNGKPSIQVIVQDISERKHAEEALKQSEHVLRLFVEHSPASIAMFDRNMNYIVASARYLIDYDLPPQDLTGRSHYDVFPEIPEYWKEIHRRCLAGAIEKMDEDPFLRANGKTDWVRWEIRPWYEDAGKIGGVILFSEVITERKRIQDELRVLNLHLEQRVVERTMQLSQANRAKDEFLANMSHELRTPLNTVLGLSETLLEQRRGPLNEKQIQSLQLISASGQHLLGLINDILEVSKIEAGKLELHSSMVSLKELCEASLNFIKELALKKSVAVEFRNETSIPALRADPQRLKQILINLLTNAVKFTPENGKVSLHVYTNDEKDRIIFSITDTGIGIAAEDLKKLFTPFMQLDSSLARQYPGTGLGLALVQKLTELHGGSVHVESEPGMGSRFTIHLPLFQKTEEQSPDDNLIEPATNESNPARASITPKEHGTILLAEDNEINSTMIREYLETKGYNILVAQNGEEVLDKAAEFAPDIILMDIQMPKMDGLEATRHLRADSRFASTPIIALTALAMPGDKERCFEAGVNEYLSKPVSLKMLRMIIESLLEN